MKKILLLILCAGSILSEAQTDSVKAVQEIQTFQNELNAEYKDPEKSPLEARDIKKFNGHPFFAINLSYRVPAKLYVTTESTFFPMKTTTSRLPNYRIYGRIEFSLGDKTFNMPVYQSQDLLKRSAYVDYLFFPFTDMTNGNETYAGGRYLDFRIPKEGKQLTIDFNQAYNPYCAYNHIYSCPLVPEENAMDIEIRAGVMYRQKK
ncbi:MAG: DUF1684 domain-containing protein [Cyclobacteriaceae bacterium]|nr:DUF1684 domain-containing protein [Cyclobacteriaceae bacterium]